MTAVAMVPAVSIVVASLVTALWTDVNLFCGCDSLRLGRESNSRSRRSVVSVSDGYC